MSIIDRDLIMRQIRFLQQLLQRVLKLQAEQDFPTALELLHSGYREALGIPYEMLSGVDAASARILLSSPERRESYAKLLRAEAELLRAQGRDAEAARLEARAAEIAPAVC